MPRKIFSINVKIKTLQIIYHIMFVVSFSFCTIEWFGLGILSYLLLGKIGIELSMHRYFSHNTYSTGKFRHYLLLSFATLAGLGSPITWVGTHRLHHQFSDTANDPHSPVLQSPWRIYLTLWRPFQIPSSIIRDLLKNRQQIFIHKYYFHIHFFVCLTLSLINWRLPFFVIAWGSVLAFHIAGLTNTLGHLLGNKNYLDYPGYNMKLLNWLTWGTSLHNNHHRWPNKISNATTPDEFDLYGWMIKHIWSNKKVKL